jgi:hypothetical protein
MRQIGIAVPDDVIVEHSHLNRKVEIAKRIKRLNGGEEPSEQQIQLQQELQALEIRAKEAEVAEREADAQLKQANAALSMSRAQNEQQGGNENAKFAAEMQVKQQEMTMDQQAKMADMKLRSMEAAHRMRLEREKLDHEIALKREELAASIELKRAAAKSPTKQTEKNTNA